MSLINQMLNDLEKRGVSALPGEPSLHVVNRQANWRAWGAGLLVLLALIILLALGWQLVKHKTSAPNLPPVTANTVPPVVAKPLSSAPITAETQDSVPLIHGISPQWLVAKGVTQPFIINGSHFAQGAMVTLRTLEGQVFANRPVYSISPTQIIINPNFGVRPHQWTVEVANAPGVMSGQFAFTVQAAPGIVPVITPQQAPVLGQELIKANPPPASESAPTPLTPAPGVISATGVEKQVSLKQQADNEFRKATGLMQQGRSNEALAGFAATLQLYPAHDAARQAMAGLLAESKRNAEAEQVLLDGLKLNPKAIGLAMQLARLQVERDALQLALDNLMASLPYAAQQADYQAFVAAVLQRLGRHMDAAMYYRAALQITPNSGVWWMGLGISLQALQNSDDARAAFQRALDTHTLSSELQAFVAQRLKEL